MIPATYSASSPLPSSADAAAIAEVERRLFKFHSGEQDPALRMAHRRYLELNELLESAENYGDLSVRRGILLGRARTLKLSATSEEGKLLSVDINKAICSSEVGTIEGGALGSPGQHEGICRRIEQKRDSIWGIPGIDSLSDYPSESEVEGEQSKLLAAHIRYMRELANEVVLLMALVRHNEEHPVYEVAKGLERYFGGLIYSLSLKLQIISADMYHTLYSPEIAAAVERLRRILETKEAELLKEQAVLDERLAIYREAGSEFQEIAAAYADILKETKQIRQDIARVEQL